MKQQGFIKIFRQMTKWEWYTDIPVKVLFIHLLISANHEQNFWKGLTVEKGQLVTSLEHLASESGLSIQQVRTALKKLKSTQEVTYKTTNRNTVITVKNWDRFQVINTNSNKQITNKQQTNNKQITTNNNEKNEKNEKNNLSLLKEDEREILKKYVQKNCKNVVNPDAYIHTLIQNGDYKQILEEERKKQERRMINTITNDLKDVKDRLTACLFIGKYGDFTDENHPEEVKQVMAEYGFKTFTDAVDYSYSARGKNVK